MMKKLILTLVLLSLLHYGCEESLDPTEINLFTAQDDVNLGAELVTQIEANPNEYPILNDASANNYLQNIVNEIIQSPEIEYFIEFDYTIKIVQRDDVINAFAVPGGAMYIYTGLLKFIDNEATLAGILAHEVAHIERRHASKRMTKQYGVSFLLGLLLGDDPSQLESVASEMLTGLAMLKNSRDDEYEADEYSFKYLQSTEWYPGAIIYFFNKVKGNEDESFLQEILSTHPLSADRIAVVEELINSSNIGQPNESNLFTERYNDFVKTLP